MALMPPAEVLIDEALIRGLLRAQAPERADARIHSVQEGWDNVVARLDDDAAVRMPRRSAAAELILAEHRWLPSIAARVSVPVPQPLVRGRASGDYPWAWSIVPWLPGEALVDVTEQPLTSLAADLASFVTELHTAAPPDAPHNAVRGVPLAARAHVVRERLASGAVPRADELTVLWERLRIGEEWRREPVWLHGDLHPGNILVATAAGGLECTLAAVIDFGDVCAGDPATDLAAAWLAFDANAREAFFEALPRHYRDDAELRRRAEGWALVLATAFAAHSDDNPAMASIGEHVITQLLGAQPSAA